MSSRPMHPLVPNNRLVLENLEPVSSYIRRAVIRRLNNLTWNRYHPVEPARLESKIRNFLSLPPDCNLKLHAGTEEIIGREIARVAIAGGTVHFPEHAYPGFVIACRRFGAKHNRYSYNSDLGTILENAPRKDSIFVCLPDCPLKGPLPESFLGRSRDAQLHIDCAYADPFGLPYGSSYGMLIAHADSVLISFSKALGLAGIRLGIQLKKATSPYSFGENSSGLSALQLSFVETLTNTKIVRDLKSRVKRLWATHSVLGNELSRCGFPSIYSDSPLFQTVAEPVLDRSGKTIWESLTKKRYKIAGESFIRISASSANTEAIRRF